MLHSWVPTKKWSPAALSWIEVIPPISFIFLSGNTMDEHGPTKSDRKVRNQMVILDDLHSVGLQYGHSAVAGADDQVAALGACKGCDALAEQGIFALGTGLLPEHSVRFLQWLARGKDTLYLNLSPVKWTWSKSPVSVPA